MKKFYPFVLLIFLVAGCSKDFLKRYDDRIVGTWRLTDVDRRGFGGSISHLPFTSGEFVFEESGRLTYTSSTGALYEGNWDIRKRHLSGNCYTTEDGNTSCNDRSVHTLSLTAVDFASQDVKAEHFDDMIFTGTNRFKAYIYDDFHTYIFHFRR